MRISTKGIAAAGVVLLASATPSLAIEGLQLSVQCPDVVLGWPSAPGENYIVQWRPTLSPSTPWVTLTNSLPADWTTNWTTFVDSNRVQCALGGTNSFSGGGGEPPPVPSLAGRATSTSQVPEPLVRRADGSGSAVPLCIYPPGFDLSGFIILDPSTGEWVSGSGYTISQPSLNRPQRNDPQPQDDPQDDPTPPDPGFYQVVKDGVRIVGLTNLTGGVILSNTVNIAFEAGNADWRSGTNVLGILSSATLIVDAAKFAGDGVLSAPPTYPWQFAMDTAYLENGDHYVQVGVTWHDPEATDPNDIFPTRYSDPFWITVSNAIYYPQWVGEVGEADIAAFFAKTACTSTDWQIDICDIRSNLVQTLTGHTDDGTIEAYWNLVDTNGVTRTNADFDPQFSSVITVSDPASKKGPATVQRRKDWPDQGIWTVAYQDIYRHWYSANDDMTNSLNAFAWTAAKYGGYWLYAPQPGQTNDIGQTYPLRWMNPWHPEDGVTTSMVQMDYAMLKLYLGNTNSRNFFFRGHGTPSAFGDISFTEITNVVKHRYRLVILQACHTAEGNLDHAFGIKGPAYYDDLSYYRATGRRPAAFMGGIGVSRFANPGPTTIGGVHYDGTIPWQVPWFYYDLLFALDYDNLGWGLQDALEWAIAIAPPVDGWPTDQQPGRSLIIYGYRYLHIDEYNHDYQWP